MIANKFDFILKNDDGVIIRTLPFSFDEIFDECGSDFVLEQDQYYINSVLTKIDIEDTFLETADIIAKRRCIGLKDKNNKYIFEDDILQMYGVEGHKYRVVIDEVYTGKFVTYGVGLQNIEERDAIHAIDVDDLKDLEIIGNMYEKELK